LAHSGVKPFVNRTEMIPNLLREEEIKSKIKMLKKQAKDEMTKPKAILMFFRVQY